MRERQREKSCRGNDAATWFIQRCAGQVKDDSVSDENQDLNRLWLVRKGPEKTVPNSFNNFLGNRVRAASEAFVG